MTLSAEVETGAATRALVLPAGARCAAARRER